MEAVAVLLALFGSLVEDETVAVFVMTTPSATSGATRTTRRNVADAPEFKVATVHVAVPDPPLAGVAQANVGVPVWVIETKVVFGGITSLSDTFAAAVGPLFETVTV